MSFFSWKRRMNTQASSSSGSPQNAIAQLAGQARIQTKDTVNKQAFVQQQQHADNEIGLDTPTHMMDQRGANGHAVQSSSSLPGIEPYKQPAYPWSTRRLQLPPPAILPKPGVAPPSNPSPSPFPRYGHSLPTVATQTGELLFFGGLVKDSVRNDLYSFSSRELSATLLQTAGEVPSPRVGHASALVSSVLIVWGGDTISDGRLYVSDTPDNGLYLLNLVTREWSRVAISGPAPTGRYGHAVAMVGTRFYIFGGQVDGEVLNDLWAFDLNTLRNKASWELIKPTSNEGPTRRTGHICISYGDRIIMIGGTDSQYHYNDTWAFDTNSRQWTELNCIGFIPSPREGHAATLVNDVIYIFGGRGVDGTELGDLAAFRISNQRWYMFQNMGPAPTVRTGHRMAAVGSRVFVLGGESFSAGPSDDPTIIHVLDTKRIKYPEPIKSPSPNTQEPATAQRPSVTTDQSPKPSPPGQNTLPNGATQLAKLAKPGLASDRPLAPASSTVLNITAAKSVGNVSNELAQLSITAGSSTSPLRDILAKLTYLDLVGKVTYNNSTIKAHGGYCDVFLGEYVDSSSNVKVAVKRLRVHAQGSHDFAKQLAKEMNVWSKLVHPNILHLWGYVLEGDYPCLVSQWMDNGTILRYLTISPDCDVIRLILGIASGLEYLHDHDIIHSDIKADNVLVSPDGRPLICDFGISRRISTTHTALGATTTGAIKGSLRWMSPEILDLSNDELIPGHTKEADVWAFGMLVYEVLTQKLPFYHLKLDVHAMIAIMSGKLPSSDPLEQLPPRLQSIWSLCCDKSTCWNKDPTQRPSMQTILSDLERCSSLTQKPIDFEHCS